MFAFIEGQYFQGLAISVLAENSICYIEVDEMILVI